ncbi:MAG TPA: DHA2 family efflux MFS transporter permease subunit [Patescibacteria group bacterium]|jgi:DHA2 family multidrug resistance protein|nr:DHA2 family efflux MFS transporter permease subunit [Patescibacteria group bacterium]
MEKKVKATTGRGFQSHEWIILFTVMIASFLGRLDGTVVNLALPKMISDFGITVSEASWISTAYIIANAIFVPIFGKLGDLIGRKPLYLFGIIGFVVSSIFAGLSANLPQMIIFRILQAITVSIDYPLALSIIAFTFQDRQKRAQAMGLWSAVFGVAAVFGPLLGGPLIDNFSWRSVFYINVPIGILGAFMAWKYIQEPVKKIRGIKNFDIWGSLLLGSALGTLVLVLDQGQSWGWFSLNSVVSYIVTAVSFVAFILVEQRQKEPVVDLKFFKIPEFAISLLVSFITFMGMIGGLFLLPIFVQSYMGYDVTKTGYLFLPMAAGMMIGAQTGARLSARFTPKYVVFTGLMWAAFILYLFSGIDLTWTFTHFAILLALFALGLGLTFAPITNASISTVPLHEVGVASSILALVRNIAGAFGVAIFATILTNSVTAGIMNVQKFSVINSFDPNVLKQAAYLMIIKANLVSFHIVFLSSAAITFVGALSALLLRETTKEMGGKAEVSGEGMM